MSNLRTFQQSFIESLTEDSYKLHYTYSAPYECLEIIRRTELLGESEVLTPIQVNGFTYIENKGNILINWRILGATLYELTMKEYSRYEKKYIEIQEAEETQPEKMTRLQILENSLIKKQALFDSKLNSHFADVKSANGQPLNDKRNGHVTLNRWEKQNDSLRNLQKEIEKTKNAIENEKDKIEGVERTKDILPTEILSLINEGKLTQWRKYPNMFFVVGVEKARIIWEVKKKQVAHKFVSSITDAEQRKLFAQIYNSLNKALNK